MNNFEENHEIRWDIHPVAVSPSFVEGRSAQAESEPDCDARGQSVFAESPHFVSFDFQCAAFFRANQWLNCPILRSVDRVADEVPERFCQNLSVEIPALRVCVRASGRSIILCIAAAMAHLYTQSFS